MFAIKNSTITKVLFGLGLATLGLVGTPSSASAVSFTPLTNYGDAEFNNGILNGDFSEVFVAEGRIGNNRANGTEREFGINDALVPDPNQPGKLMGGSPLASGDRTWVSGNLVDFILTYNGSLVEYTLGGQKITANVGGKVTDFYLRTRSNATSSLTLSNLMLNGVSDPINNSLTSIGNQVSYLKISDFTQPFTLAGKAQFSWTGSAPQRSQLAFQLKAVNTPKQTPEPGTLGAMMILGVASMGYAKRKQLKVNN